MWKQSIALILIIFAMPVFAVDKGYDVGGAASADDVDLSGISTNLIFGGYAYQWSIQNDTNMTYVTTNSISYIDFQLDYGGFVDIARMIAKDFSPQELVSVGYTYGTTGTVAKIFRWRYRGEADWNILTNVMDTSATDGNYAFNLSGISASNGISYIEWQHGILSTGSVGTAVGDWRESDTVLRGLW